MNNSDSPSPSAPEGARNKPYRRRALTLLVSLLALVLIGILIKKHQNKPVRGKPPIHVAVAKVTTRDVPVFLTALGNVIATYTITVKTQINGLLMKVHYKEGQRVKTGDLLAEIDQRLLLAQLEQYKGQLIRDEALLANAQVDLARYQQLWKQDSISQQTLATQESLVKQYQGAIEIDKGLIESTQVNLIYSHITSPIDGRIGLRLVDPGNFVQTTDTTGLFVITSINPITVIFTIPEDDVPRILPQIFSQKTLEVKAYDRQQNKQLATGTLLAINNQIDTTTGTVRLRAQFDNPDSTLFPNQFVNIKLLVETLTQATVIPTAAIIHGSKGDFVFRLNDNKTVTRQAVKTGVTTGEETVIREGLTAGQQVVVDGLDKLTSGASVRVS